MPIYEYRCRSCGFEKEYLQKLSDAPIEVCETCGQATMSKLLSAAGFQLKGSGWYATDFKNPPAAKVKPSEADHKESAGKESAGKESAGKETASKETAGKESASEESASKESASKESAVKDGSAVASGSSAPLNAKPEPALRAGDRGRA